MPKTYVSVGIAAVAFAVGLLVGLFIKGPHAGGGPCDTAQDQHLNVSSSGQVDCEEAKIKRTNTVFWQPPSGYTLRIEFQDPSIFPNMTPSGPFVNSGRPNSNASTVVTYPYKASVWGAKTPTPLPEGPHLTPNARIIIMP